MSNSNKFNSFRRTRVSSETRKSSVKNELKNVLIVCEGKVTEPAYLNEILKHYRLINNVKVVSSNKGSSPENVLECAKSFIKKDGYDQAFCVFDKDKHSTYSSVVNKIKNIRNISSINSVPCFEYWLLLHFEYTTSACYTNSDPVKYVIGCLKRFDPSYCKSSKQDFSKYIKMVSIAVEHAIQSLIDASSNGTDDPSTHMHELILFLQKLSKEVND